MGQRPHTIRRSDSGFTLTELLIVIVILGVLTGIVVFAVGAFTDRGEVAACKADRKTVEVAVEAFRSQTGAYPAAGDWAALTTDPVGPATAYLRANPNQPGDPYTITLGADGVITGSMAGC